MPKVSIIVPCYNQAQFLPETLDSVLAQTYQDWECIIINDGSPDNTEEVAKNYCAQDKRFKYIYQENKGVIAARNNAICHSLGKYILPLDSDDLVSSEYVEKAVEIIDNNDDIKIVYSKVEYFGDKTGDMRLPDYSLSTLLRANCFTNSSMFRREDYNRTGGYNPNMKEGLEDWDFWLSILEKGGKPYKLDFTGLYYRIINNKVSRNKNAINQHLKLRLQMFNNHIDLYFKDYNQIYKNFYNLQKQYNDITKSRLYPIFKMIKRIKRIVFKI